VWRGFVDDTLVGYRTEPCQIVCSRQSSVPEPLYFYFVEGEWGWPSSKSAPTRPIRSGAAPTVTSRPSASSPRPATNGGLRVVLLHCPARDLRHRWIRPAGPGLLRSRRRRPPRPRPSRRAGLLSRRPRGGQPGSVKDPWTLRHRGHRARRGPSSRSTTRPRRPRPSERRPGPARRRDNGEQLQRLHPAQDAERRELERACRVGVVTRPPLGHSP
jgi:hypothetical protein